MAPGVARAAACTRTQGKTALFPQGEGSAGIEIETNVKANLLRNRSRMMPALFRGKNAVFPFGWGSNQP